MKKYELLNIAVINNYKNNDDLLNSAEYLEEKINDKVYFYRNLKHNLDTLLNNILEDINIILNDNEEINNINFYNFVDNVKDIYGYLIDYNDYYKEDIKYNIVNEKKDITELENFINWFLELYKAKKGNYSISDTFINQNINYFITEIKKYFE